MTRLRKEEGKSFRELQEECDRLNKESEAYEQAVAPTYGFRRHYKAEVQGGQIVHVEQ